MSNTDLDKDTPSDTSPERGSDRVDRSDRSDRGDRSGSDRHERNEHAERGRSIRDELKASFADADRDDRSRNGNSEPPGRPARRAKEAAAEPGSAGAAAAPDATGTAGSADAPLDTSAPPAAWTSSAKQAWPKLPAEVQAAVAKREVDGARGVAELKQKYAAEEAAWAPWEPALRQASVPRARAISNFMSWHDYLRRAPLEAFPALVKSIGAEPAFRELLRRQQMTGAQQPQQGDPFQQYAASVEQRLNNFQQTIQQQEEARGEAHANAVLDEFKKGKPHFERVRVAMSALIGQGIIPLTPQGAVPLQEAYDMAVRMDPELGEQVIAERIAAKEKRQREEAQRARRSSASLAPFAPGSNNSIGPKKRTGARSVRELDRREHR